MFALLERIAPRRRIWTIPIALLFAVHPIHTEAVTYVAGRAELLAALAGLGGYLLWLRPRSHPILLALCFALAAAAKESAFAWIVLLAAHRSGWFRDDRSYSATRAASPSAFKSALRMDAAVLAGFSLYLVARWLVLGSLFGLADVAFVDNPLYHAPLGARILTAVKVLAIGIGLILFPDRLSADYSYAAIPVETRALSGAGLAGLLLLAAAVTTLVLRRRAPLICWSATFYAVMVLPVSNLVLPIGTIMAERLLYLPALGIIAAVAALLAPIAERRQALRQGGMVVLAIVLILLAGRTVQRNRDWRDDATLFRAAVAAQPHSAKARANLGTVLSKAERWGEAEREYRAAASICPDYPAALNGLGYVLTMQKAYPEATEVLRRACRLSRQSVEARVRLGNLWLETEQADSARVAFEDALRIDHDMAEGWIGKASALFMLGRFRESAAAWREAQRRSPPTMDLRRHLAAALHRAGERPEAERLFRELVQEQPHDAGLLAGLAAVVLDEGGRAAEAADWARQAVAVLPSEETLDLLVRALLASGDCDGAQSVVSSQVVSTLNADEQAALVRLVRASCR